MRSVLFFIVCDGSLPLVSFTSSVFHVLNDAYFTCIWVVIFLDLELQKWPDFCISRCGRGRRFFFDGDRVIVDRGMRGSSKDSRQNFHLRRNTQGNLSAFR